MSGLAGLHNRSVGLVFTQSDLNDTQGDLNEVRTGCVEQVDRWLGLLDCLVGSVGLVVFNHGDSMR